MLKMANMISLLGCLTFVASGYGEFLVGEDTPVWIARGRGHEESVNYTRLPESPVKKAIDEWKAAYKPESWNNTLMNILMPSDDVSEVPVDSAPEVVTIQPIERRIIHVLVVMDYPSRWPANLRNVEITSGEKYLLVRLQKHINKQIVYAVTFWNGIHQQLKYNSRSRFGIKIAGIVIGRNKEAMPYLRKNENSKRLNVNSATVGMMLKHWSDVASVNPDFPLDGHHVLATMTEMPACDKCRIWSAAKQHGHDGFLYCDTDLTRELRILNEETLGRTLGIWKKAKFTQYEHLRTGQAIEAPPLPGQLISVNEQCRAWGWDEENRFCIESGSLPCDDLLCKNPDSQCETPNRFHATPPLDGSFCERGAICLKGYCVSSVALSSY